MRIMISGNISDVEVIAEPFTIDGSSEVFAVHPALDFDVEEGKSEWTATHVETGFAIGRGASIDAAIANGRAVWLSKTPEQIESARQAAKFSKAARNIAAMQDA